VAYVDTGRAWVVAGAPIAREEEWSAIAARFAERARAARRRASFFAVEQRFVERTKLPALPIGEQAVWETAKWEEALRRAKSLREQVRRARAKGVVVRAIDARTMVDRATPERRAVEALVERWLASRGMAPMGFLVDVQPFTFAEERRYVVAEREGRI